MKRLTLIFISLILFCSTIYCQDETKKNNYFIGLTYGFPQYYIQDLSTDPTVVRYVPNIFDTDDIRSLNFYLEMIKPNGSGFNIELGYMEFWSGYVIFTDGPVYFGWNNRNLIGTTMKLSGNWVFERKVRWMLVGIEAGLTYYYNYESSQYGSGLKVDGYEIFVETNPVRNHFMTLGIGPYLKIPFHRFKAGLKVNYNQGLTSNFRSIGPYSTKDGRTGYFEAKNWSSHTLIEFLLEFRINKLSNSTNKKIPQ